MAAAYKAAPLSRQNIRHFVKLIRKITGTENLTYFPIVQFMENVLPQIIEGFSYEIVPVEEMPDKCGETYPALNLIKIREDIYCRAVQGDGFSRLTVGHETGHLLINDEHSISLCKIQPGTRLKAYEDPEWQANCFAGELLMYYPLVKDFSVDDLREKCGVTLSAATYQKSKM